MSFILPDISNVQEIKTRIVFYENDGDIDVKPVDVGSLQDLDEDPISNEVSINGGKHYILNSNDNLSINTSTNKSLSKRCKIKNKTKRKAVYDKPLDVKLKIGSLPDLNEPIIINYEESINGGQDHYYSSNNNLNTTTSTKKTLSKICNDEKKTKSKTKQKINNENQKKERKKRKKERDQAKNNKSYKKRNNILEIPANEINVKTNPIKERIFKQWSECNKKKIEPLPKGVRKSNLKETRIDEANQKNISSNKSDDQNKLTPSKTIKSFFFEKGPDYHKIRITYPITKPSQESIKNTPHKIQNILETQITDKSSLVSTDDDKINCDINVCFGGSKMDNTIPTPTVLPKQISYYDSVSSQSNNSNIDYNLGKQIDAHETHSQILDNKTRLNLNRVQLTEPIHLQETLSATNHYSSSTHKKDANTNISLTMVGTTTKVKRKYNQSKITKKPRINKKNYPNIELSHNEQMNNHPPHSMTGPPPNSLPQLLYLVDYLRQCQQNIIKYSNINHKDNTPMHQHSRANPELQYKYNMNHHQVMRITESNQNYQHPNTNQLNNIHSHEVPSQPYFYPYENSMHQHQMMQGSESRENLLHRDSNQTKIPMRHRPIPHNPELRSIYNPMVNNMTGRVIPEVRPPNHHPSLNISESDAWRCANLMWKPPQITDPTQEFWHLNPTTARASFPRRSLSRDSGYFSPLADNMDCQAMTHTNTPSKSSVCVADTKCIVCNTRTKSNCLECQGSYYCSKKCQYMDWNNHKSQCKGLVNEN